MLKVANSVISASRITGTLPVANGGTGVTTSTGTTNVVLSDSPTLVTPTLGAALATSIKLGAGTVLSSYEEGTWTPTNIGGSLVVVGAFSSNGTYTKIGKLITVQGTLNGTTSVSISGGANVVCGGLPFSAASGVLCPGVAINGGATASAVLYANSGTSVGSVTALAASTTIFFSITYFV